MSVLWSIAQAVAENGAEIAEEGSLLGPILLALLLFVLAAFLILLEFFLISGGLLTAVAAVLAVIAIWMGFHVDPVLGWSMLIIAPILAGVIVRYGLRRMQRSSLVTQVSIDGDAGYHHLAETYGIAVGAVGTLSTDAYPTGRCRFAGGEVDVVMRNGSGKRGQRVKVSKLEGASIHVSLTDSAGENE
ncbi:MAG: hypothetical protein EA401_03755 [Planctomycetota bacterium]|nr:MAG: hypothetical protein EA401_03755 [Planctomycetota bacterium]